MNEIISTAMLVDKITICIQKVRQPEVLKSTELYTIGIGTINPKTIAVTAYKVSNIIRIDIKGLL